MEGYLLIYGNQPSSHCSRLPPAREIRRLGLWLLVAPPRHRRWGAGLFIAGHNGTASARMCWSRGLRPPAETTSTGRPRMAVSSS